MPFLRYGSEIDADLVHNSGTIIRFKTSQLDQLPELSRSCTILLPDETIADCNFNCNKANPNITGTALVKYIKSVLAFRTSVKVKLLDDGADGVIALRLPMESGEISDIATQEDEHDWTINIDDSDLDEVIDNGCFLSKEEIRAIMSLWINKKNLILQGPPGTGKTWIARRLGKILIGKAACGNQLRTIQFHPNYSYEDFVRGWRPGGDGRLNIVDGIFMQIAKDALHNMERPFILVIEEVNRGSPAQIFGELLTLLEAGKRTPDAAMQLCYPDADGEHRPIHIPDNLFVIGTMNIADRSLALVDLAFRRRFAFVNLEPRIDEKWRSWVVSNRHMNPADSALIAQRMHQLNKKISEDGRLGKAFCIGHSYVTPSHSLEGRSTREWFAQVVESELKPLLEEYWFDSPELAKREADRLLEGW
jgi:5-methylcytosine-specific restriction protein B